MNKQAAFTDVVVHSPLLFSKGEADAWTVVLHANLHAGLLGPCGFCFLVVNNMSNNDVYNVPDDGAVLLSSMFTCKRKCVSRYKSTTWVSLESLLEFGYFVPQHLHISLFVFEELILLFHCSHWNRHIWHADHLKGATTLSASLIPKTFPVSFSLNYKLQSYNLLKSGSDTTHPSIHSARKSRLQTKYSFVFYVTYLDIISSSHVLSLLVGFLN